MPRKKKRQTTGMNRNEKETKKKRNERGEEKKVGEKKLAEPFHPFE
jgi:hypothetical protein